MGGLCERLCCPVSVSVCVCVCVCGCMYWVCGTVGLGCQDPRPSGVLFTHSTRTLSVRINIDTYFIVSPPLNPFKQKKSILHYGRYK